MSLMISAVSVFAFARALLKFFWVMSLLWSMTWSTVCFFAALISLLTMYLFSYIISKSYMQVMVWMAASWNIHHMIICTAKSVYPIHAETQAMIIAPREIDA